MIDYFQIQVDDRISLTQDFALSPAEVDQLIAEGITSAGNLANFRFFTNDFDTETTGFDIEAAYNVGDALTLVIGAQNALDETPDENPGAAGGVGNRYSQFSPFGFNGSFWYLRARYELN